VPSSGTDGSVPPGEPIDWGMSNQVEVRHPRPMNRAFWGAGVVCLVALLAPVGRAQTCGLPPILAGVYAYPHAPEHGRDLVLASIEPRLAGLPGFMRDVVRGQMEQRIQIPRRITIALPDPIVSVTYEGDRTTVVASAIGASTTITSRDGDSIPVVQRIQGGWLEQTFTGPNGTLRMLLSTEPDGETLHADGTMTSERLGQPVAVRLDYQRVH
jgi:hypothetical protein